MAMVFRKKKKGRVIRVCMIMNEGVGGGGCVVACWYGGEILVS